MATKWIPNFIKRTIQYNAKDVLTAQEYNAILNLLITQGDYNSSWLEYLQNDAIPEAIREIGIEEIEEVLTTVVEEEIAALAASTVNKTSEQLNNPMVTILNTGIQWDGIDALNTLLTSKSLKGTYCCATNLVGFSAAYPSLAQLTALDTAGNDIVAYSTDGATMTAAGAATAVDTAYDFMYDNGFNIDSFVYPNGNSIDDVRDAVHSKFHYAVNMLVSGVITPDGILADSPASVLGNLAVVEYDSTVDPDTVKAYVDDIVQHNKYMILKVNTDSENYDAAGLAGILDYIKTKSSIVFPSSITNAMLTIHNTIGNKLELVEGISITEVNGEKYLNW